MDNPFPGMNPYLEHPQLWHQVHNRLIVAIADDLTPQVAPRYRVAIEERVYQSIDDSLSVGLVGIADVALTRRSAGDIEPSSQIAPASKKTPIPVQVPVPQEVVERFLEVRSTQTGEVVCVIEILSPKNKRNKDGRAAYISKRQKILGSSTSLVEIDLLREGEPMPILGAADSLYRILISRASHRPIADLYAFELQDPIPAIPIPLLVHDPEPVVNLQRILNDVYRRARFDLAIDYTQPPKPALRPEDEAWVREILQQADLENPV
ncbi:DUF4058 family protein [Thermoleptolyngbya sichuanensis A183]|uniref:DUF4058 family protein n=1 Tax=Thermoleptolyngbya sichuanensis A183 TaxID=2737172 RepID=A0A6M8B7P5_9CYAN|nr:DUF4058 family protein [Thermoleptolyngbya sichuanensis]QKD83379.1 DUF4058 family protein [Thermoleptolyngbya sichuanensis A183]